MNSARLLRTLTAAAVFVSGLAVAAPASAATTITRVVFSDDFSGDRGTAPDPAKWVPQDDGDQDDGDQDDGDQDDASLDGEGNVTLDDPLRTVRTFASSNGHAEARIKPGREYGAWRALAVLDESGQLPAGQVEPLADDRVNPDEFHTYTIDWTATSIVWSVDGTKVLRFTPAESGKPFHLVLNVTMGERRSPDVVVDSVRVTVKVTVATKPWKKFTTYKAGQYVTYKDVAYRVRERHTSLPGWQPSLVPALFQKI
ncbi:carbohydrate-binding protein [Actinoplanes sp. CA-015351]|uniref:carbohydrate-binding protein n=1 Tax=Actinoplanes sp. CA-015351 TaxID=3239897 RepID=UPI003D982B9E